MDKVYAIDNGIAAAIDLFIMHGCNPGACTSLLLQEKFDEAMLRAHQNIRPLLDGEYSSYAPKEERQRIWDSHVDYVKDIVPHFVKGKNFHTWKGFDSITDKISEEIMVAKLSGNDKLLNLYNDYKGRIKERA